MYKNLIEVTQPIYACYYNEQTKKVESSKVLFAAIDEHNEIKLMDLTSDGFFMPGNTAANFLGYIFENLHPDILNDEFKEEIDEMATAGKFGPLRPL